MRRRVIAALAAVTFILTANELVPGWACAEAVPECQP